MANTLRVAFIVLAFALAGCAATVQRQGGSEARLALPASASAKLVFSVEGSGVAAASKDWEPFVGEWRKAMSAAAASSGVAFTFQEGPVQPGPEAATLVILKVNDYRYVSPAARYAFGVMTGNAFIDADATFFELPGKKPVGARKYNTSSSAWQGVFSAMTDKQVLGICTEIVREVTGR